MPKETLILSKSEYLRLLEEVRALQARISELTALRDDLVYHVCPALRAEYDEKIVSLERELMASQMYLKQMQRTIEILQAQMNQKKKMSMEEAEAQAKKENREFEEELNRKAKEAGDFRKKWEESQWSRHDRQEKEDRHGEKEGGFSGDDETRSAGDEAWSKDDGAGSRDDAGDPDAGRDKKDQDHTDRQEDSDSSSRNKKKETPGERIKRLYRKIVKRLHPDVHPDLTEHEKELWNRAVKAQQEGDLEQLERIWDELSGMDAPEDMFEDTPEGREKLKELLVKLKARLQALMSEIDHIKSDFPYKFKTFLEDPEAVEEARRKLQARIDNVREMNRQLEKYIRELREKLRNADGQI